MSGGRERSMRKRSVGIVITIVVIVLAAVGAFGLKKGWFLPPKYRVLKALANTVEASEIARCAGGVEFFTQGEKSVSGNVRWNEFGETELLAVLDESSLKVQIPTFGELVFVYPYEGEKSDFLVRTAGEEQLDNVDAVLRFLYAPTNAPGEGERTLSDLQELLDDLEFEEYDEAERETEDGTACKAYSVTASNDMLRGLPVPDDLPEEVQLVFYLAKERVTALEVREEGELLWQAEILMTEEEEQIVIADADSTLYEIGCKAGEECITIESGNYKNADRRNRFRIQMEGDGATIDLRDVSCMEQKISGTLYMRLATEEDEPEGEEINLGGMNKEDWEAVLDEIKTRLIEKALFFFN